MIKKWLVISQEWRQEVAISATAAIKKVQQTSAKLIKDATTRRNG
tara:strand:- start:1119 stop:1253 length:135 start_codon:yes stop_codon:yes gene_type:complete